MKKTQVNDLPKFSNYNPAQAVQAIEEHIQANKKQLEELLRQEYFSWENLMQPIEEAEDSLGKLFGPLSHLHSVCDSEVIRKAYNDILPKIVQYGMEVAQNKNLYEAIANIKAAAEFDNLSIAQKKIIENELRDFKLAGVHLGDDKKQVYRDKKAKLERLTTKFSENVLDATGGWVLHVEEKEKINMLPADAIVRAQEKAKQKDLTGYAFGLDFPQFNAIMTYAKDSNLRKQMYLAYQTRASDHGPTKGKWDNTQNIHEILTARKELSKILEFKDFAEYSLARKMAESPEKVLTFLNDLAQKAKPFAQQELKILSSFAREVDDNENLQPWDTAYYAEKYKQKHFKISGEELRKYFPIGKVLQGLFAIVNKLYGINLKEVNTFDKWHDDVKLLEIQDKNNVTQAYIYMDLYAREHKKGGAWMDECLTRAKLKDNLQLPVAYVVGNFTPPNQDGVALLTHRDVETLFHEVGHALHHTLTQVDYLGVSGIAGVEWDAVELPSQFMENWCWEQESLQLISAHIETGNSLPAEMIERLNKVRTYNAGMQTLRQIEFALFDFRIHMEYNGNIEHVQQILDEVRNKVSVMQTQKEVRFQNSFSHIFAGGYAAGYYSYKWAEVLAQDAFYAFKQKNIFDKELGRKFKQSILEVGGSKKALEAFIDFRGREPSVEPLLELSGLKN